MTKNIKENIKKSIVKEDYDPVNVSVKSKFVNIVAPLDKRSSACSIVRKRGKNTNKPRFVIIHGTTPGLSEKSGLSSMDAYHISLCANQGTTWKYRNKNYLKPAEKKGGSGHYTIFKSGKISQHINETDPVKQCESYNLKSIGIEHHFIFGKESPTIDMYKASANLVRDIVKRYNMLQGGKNYEDVVLPHDPNYDPGPYWDWGYFFSLLKDSSHTGSPRSKQETEQNIGTDWKDPSLPSPSYGPRKKIRPGKELPFYKKDQEKKALSDEDIENGILPFLIDEILENDAKYRQYLTTPFLSIETGAASSYINNLIFGKNLINYKNYSSLTNIELSNFVPFVELYLLKDDGEYMYPFDDYTSRSKIENIFKDKTGRGGAVGIKEVLFKSLATNQSNLAQQTVKISFLIQDIQEIEAVRNEVSLLDFLYPAGSRDPFEYNKNNFNVKMKLGWRYKNNSLTSNVKNKISKDLLEETIFLSLFKHSFEFNEKDGTVTLDVEYIGMLETELADSFENNVIDAFRSSDPKEEDIWREVLNQFNRWDKKSEQKWSNEKHSSTVDAGEETVKYSINLGDEEAEEYEGTTKDGLEIDNIKEIQEKIKQKIAQSAKGDQAKKEVIYGNFLIEMFKALDKDYSDKSPPVRFIAIEEQNLEFLKSLFSSNTSLTFEEYKKLGDIRKKSVSFFSNNKTGQASSTTTKEIENEFKKVAKGEAEKVDIKTILKILRTVATPPTLGATISLFMPYITVGEIIKIVYQKLYNHYGINFLESPLRMVFGQFSYGAYENGRPKSSQGGNAKKTNPTTVGPDGKEVFIYNYNRKYINILQIPITLKSFDNWFRLNIVDSEIKSMSFYEFIRKLMFELVASNLEPRIVSWAPQFEFTPIINFATTYKQNDPDEQTWNIGELKEGHGYMFDNEFTKEEQIKKNPLIHINKKMNNKNKNDSERIKYIFIFSANENSLTLRGDPAEDIKRNIAHLYLGEEKGLVKNIKFSREDNQQLDSTNIVAANRKEGKAGIIRQIYQLKMQMFGNTIFSPGSLVHISPSYPGSRLPNSTLYKIGLGGYYFITKLSSRVDQSGFTTDIEAKWQASGKDNESGPQYLEIPGDEADVGEVPQDELATNEQNWKTEGF